MNNHYLFITPEVSWLTNNSAESSPTILKSQISISRNLQDYPFPQKATLEELTAIKVAAFNIIPILETGTHLHFDYFELDKLTSNEQQILLEKQLISEKFLQNNEQRAFIISEDTSIVIMINEEDHFKINCFANDLDFDTLLERASLIDDIFETQFNIAFDEKLGYLSANPLNIGTAMKASIVLHLPILATNQQLAKIINIAPQIGLNIHKLYENSSTSNLFQISTLLTLGLSERAIVQQLTDTVVKLITHEKDARLTLLDSAKDEFSDRVWRSFAILKYAQLISSEEVFDLLSELRLGIDLNIIDILSIDMLNSILIISQNAYLKNLQEHEFIPNEELDKSRATVIRQYLTDSSLIQ